MVDFSHQWSFAASLCVPVSSMSLAVDVQPDSSNSSVNTEKTYMICPTSNTCSPFRREGNVVVRYISRCLIVLVECFGGGKGCCFMSPKRWFAGALHTCVGARYQRQQAFHVCWRAFLKCPISFESNSTQRIAIGGDGTLPCVYLPATLRWGFGVSRVCLPRYEQVGSFLVACLRAG